MPYINVDEAYILDNTGLQVDQVVDIPYTDAALTDGQKEQARKNIAAGGTNPNLLDNPWFTVNQRGLSTYTLTGNAYFVDRWKSSGGNTITVSTNGISIVAGTGTHQNLIQGCPIIGDLLGRTVTASVMSQTGEISSVTFTLPSSISSGSYYDGGYGMVDSVALRVLVANTYSGLPGGYAFWLYSSSTAQTVTYRAVKLELGTVSTLANDTPPNYAEELAKCQYYFRRLYTTTGMDALPALAVSATAADVINWNGGLQMRPVNGTVTYSGTVKVYDGSDHAVTAIGDTLSGTQRRLRFTTTGLTAVTACYITLNGNIDISCDL